MRRLASAIHPQLPLDARQARQLLNALNTSFETHLDTHFPTARTASGVTHSSFAKRRNSGQGSNNVRVPSFVEAQKHIASVINHPHFSSPPSIKQESQDSVECIAQKSFNIFQHHVARGTLSLHLVESCLSGIRIAPISPETRKELSYASRIMALLDTTANISSDVALSNPSIRRQWVELMFMEGREEEVWTTMRRVQRLAFGYIMAAATHRDVSFLVGSLNRILQRHKSQPRVMSSQTISTLLGLTMNLFLQTPIIKSTPNEIYQQIIQDIVALKSFDVCREQLELLNSAAQLVHPDSLNAQPAYKYLRSLNKDVDHNTPTIGYRRAMVRFYLTTAERLIEEGSVSEAEWVLQTLQSKYTQDLGVTVKHLSMSEEAPPAQSNQESSMLSKLDGLLAV